MLVKKHLKLKSKKTFSFYTHTDNKHKNYMKMRDEFKEQNTIRQKSDDKN